MTEREILAIACTLCACGVGAWYRASVLYLRARRMLASAIRLDRGRRVRIRGFAPPPPR